MKDGSCCSNPCLIGVLCFVKSLRFFTNNWVLLLIALGKETGGLPFTFMSDAQTGQGGLVLEGVSNTINVSVVTLDGSSGFRVIGKANIQAWQEFQRFWGKQNVLVNTFSTTDPEEPARQILVKACICVLYNFITSNQSLRQRTEKPYCLLEMFLVALPRLQPKQRYQALQILGAEELHQKPSLPIFCKPPRLKRQPPGSPEKPLSLVALASKFVQPIKKKT